jgi:hypothetical protein
MGEVDTIRGVWRGELSIFEGIRRRRSCLRLCSAHSVRSLPTASKAGPAEISSHLRGCVLLLLPPFGPQQGADLVPTNPKSPRGKVPMGDERLTAEKEYSLYAGQVQCRKKGVSR